ncbi:hypothetical protein RJ639_040559 [Escallonia herrerae]|uniref:Reverse transcriptase Ty1/copia-type domain-containing protein n=1 Tax=Escallonia herrerae TaxID=1293975 RepID=A0AA88WEI4_9ASTE|nr:hypothetical protein RJ639_040559 [Escallonia herrerae]
MAAQKDGTDILRPIQLILDDSNYLHWEQQMRHLLQGHPIWDYVSGSVKAPFRTDAAFEDKEADWVPGQSIQDYYSQLAILWDKQTQPSQCTNCLVHYSHSHDSKQLHQFLMGLLDDYEDQRSSLQNKNPTPTLAVALAEMKSEEVRKKVDAILALPSSNQNVLAIPAALATSSRPPFRKKWCDFHKWGFHSNDECKRNSKNKNSDAQTGKLGFASSAYDNALFRRQSDSGLILILLYVDDIIITGDDLSGIRTLKISLSQQFEMKDLGDLRYFLGLEVTSLHTGYFISQIKYASDLVSGLAFLQGTLSYGLHYPSASSLQLTAYSDVDWGRDLVDRRSTTDFCFLLSNSLISWRSKKQSIVSRSSTESEYCALADTTAELVWLRWLLGDMGVSFDSATPIHCDSQSAIPITHNDIFHERTKHIKIDCHVTRTHLTRGILQLIPVSFSNQLTDVFTKSFSVKNFLHFLSKLNLISGRPP